MDSTLSIVPSETSNEFPVLKAFQEYIDAEQAKARKRMLGLSIFFIVLLIVVVITFVLVLTTVVNRNQALSDRLLDYALKEHDKVPVIQQVAPQAPPVQQKIDPQEILKPFIERMEQERAELKASYEQQQREIAAKAAANEAARVEEMEKVKAELEKERAKIKKENERQEAIERHRRRLYPDYYRLDQNPPPTIPATEPAKRSSPPQPMRQQPAQQNLNSSAKQRQQLPAAQIPPKKKSPSSLSTIKPVTYFNMDDDVPFILETPKQNK